MQGGKFASSCGNQTANSESDRNREHDLAQWPVLRAGRRSPAHPLAHMKLKFTAMTDCIAMSPTAIASSRTMD